MPTTYRNVMLGHTCTKTYLGERPDGHLENVGYINQAGNTYHHWIGCMSDSTKQYKIDKDTPAIDQIKSIMRIRGEL